MQPIGCMSRPFLHDGSRVQHELDLDCVDHARIGGAPSARRIGDRYLGLRFACPRLRWATRYAGYGIVYGSGLPGWVASVNVASGPAPCRYRCVYDGPLRHWLCHRFSRDAWCPSVQSNLPSKACIVGPYLILGWSEAEPQDHGRQKSALKEWRHAIFTRSPLGGVLQPRRQ